MRGGADSAPPPPPCMNRVKRLPQHWCPSEGSKSELFAHENDNLTARPQLHLCYTKEKIYLPSNL